MADFWIVSGYKFQRQTSLAAAEHERARLQAKCPKQTFRVYRCKSHLSPTGAYADVLAALKGFLANERHLNDEHFSGVQERLVSLARAAVAKAEGEVDPYEGVAINGEPFNEEGHQLEAAGCGGMK